MLVYIIIEKNLKDSEKYPYGIKSRFRPSKYF